MGELRVVDIFVPPPSPLPFPSPLFRETIKSAIAGDHLDTGVKGYSPLSSFLPPFSFSPSPFAGLLRPRKTESVRTISRYDVLISCYSGWYSFSLFLPPFFSLILPRRRSELTLPERTTCCKKKGRYSRDFFPLFPFSFFSSSSFLSPLPSLPNWPLLPASFQTGAEQTIHESGYERHTRRKGKLFPLFFFPPSPSSLFPPPSSRLSTLPRS